MTQLGRYISSKQEGLNLNPNRRVKVGPGGLPPHCSGDRKIPGAHSSASLAELASFRVGETLSQKLW